MPNMLVLCFQHLLYLKEILILFIFQIILMFFAVVVYQLYSNKQPFSLFTVRMFVI
jgi:hypothetical protein